MRTALPRVRLALALALAAGVVVPLAAGAFTDVLPCGSDKSQPWQTLPVPAFPGVEGVDTVDRIASYAVETDDARQQLVTNGTTVMVSTNGGCGWEAVQSLEVAPTSAGVSGAVARITSTAILPSGRALLGVREGSGALSRPRVLGSDAPAEGGFAPSEQGLPPQGAPGQFAVGPDGRRVFLTIRTSGAASSDETAGALPVPSLPTEVAPSLLYGSNDGGRTWELRSPAVVDGAEITAIVVDRADATLLHGIAGGRLVRSTDSGATFHAVDVEGLIGVTAVVALAPGGVAAFTAPGLVFTSRDGGESFTRAPTVPNVTSAAYRAGDTHVAVEAEGDLYRVLPELGSALPTLARAARRGTLVGDTGRASTFHVISDHDVLRYSDRPTDDDGSNPPPLPDVGDLLPAPPKPGTVAPASTELSLGPGESRRVDYRLRLPANPTPLDVFFLIDTSPTMGSYIADLKANITKVTNGLARAGIDVGVGLGIVTTGPAKGDPPYPEFDPTRPDYEKPPMYRLLRPIGPVDDQFHEALQSIKKETLPSTVRTGEDPPEAQLMGLDQLVTGSGVRASYGGGLPVYVVPPGQSARFRPQSTVRRVVVHATDQAFTNPNGRYPEGSPETPDGELDFDGVIADLKREGILQIGVTNGSGESLADLSRIARGTGTLAPAGGADCDGVPIEPREPLVCPNEGDFSAVIASVLTDLTDLQRVRVDPVGDVSAVDAVVANGFQAVNVARDNALRFSVTYSCAGLLPGRYATGAEVTLRGTVVGRTATSLTCLALPAAVKPAAPAIAPQIPPHPVPVAVPVMPAAPAPPAPAQPGAQPNINPLTAAAAEEQQEAQLALALQEAEEQREEATETTDMAMVSRRREETSAALLLAMAMAGASVLGLARLRADRAARPAVARARAGR